MGDRTLPRNTPVGVIYGEYLTRGKSGTVYLVKRMATLGDYVRFLARESETEAERFEADRAFRLLLRDVS